MDFLKTLAAMLIVSTATKPLNWATSHLFGSAAGPAVAQAAEPAVEAEASQIAAKA